MVIPDANLTFGNGAYVNSQSFTSKGVETSADAQVGRVKFAASFTHFDATVTRSLSSGARSRSEGPVRSSAAHSSRVSKRFPEVSGLQC